MATDSDITKLTTEIANLELAARSFREAANIMRTQRDEARREARALRRRVRIAAAVMIATMLLVIESVVYDEAAETSSLPRLAKGNSAAVSAAARQAVTPGAALSTLLTDDDRYLIYEVVVVGKDGHPHEVSVDASSAKILQQATGEKEPDKSDE